MNTTTTATPPTQTPQTEQQEVSLKSLIDTPFKKFGFAALIISQILILGSPIIGGAIGSLFELSLGETGSAIFATWCVGEVLFFGSIFVLGKSVVTLCTSKFKKLFKR